MSCKKSCVNCVYLVSRYVFPEGGSSTQFVETPARNKIEENDLRDVYKYNGLHQLTCNKCNVE